MFRLASLFFLKITPKITEVSLRVLILFFLLPPALLFCQPSMIETLQAFRSSVVEITVENLGAVQSPHAAATIDKNTGRLLVLRNVKTAYYKRTGAGVIIDPSGLIVTNYHVIAHANKITVGLHDHTAADAKIIRIFPQDDLAFLFINPPHPLSAIQFADSDSIKLGNEVFTIGHSELLDQTIAGGKIIGLGTNRTKNDADNSIDMFQVNMNLYKGDSGGPLFDRGGQLIGLIVAGQTDVDRSSFVIPSNKIKAHYLEYLAVRRDNKK